MFLGDRFSPVCSIAIFQGHVAPRFLPPSLHPSSATPPRHHQLLPLHHRFGRGRLLIFCYVRLGSDVLVRRSGSGRGSGSGGEDGQSVQGTEAGDYSCDTAAGEGDSQRREEGHCLTMEKSEVRGGFAAVVVVVPAALKGEQKG